MAKPGAVDQPAVSRLAGDSCDAHVFDGGSDHDDDPEYADGHQRVSELISATSQRRGDEGERTEPQRDPEESDKAADGGRGLARLRGVDG